MRDLIEQERFELEALDRLNSARLLKHFVFGGGTMLRLCHGLNRFSVDLDFWIVQEADTDKLFGEVRDCLAKHYAVKDAADKFHTMVYQIRSSLYPRSLKIEVRIETRKVASEPAIAHSPHSTKQVLLNAVALNAMMASKIEAFLDRKEIRDAFDIEFLVKRGIVPEAAPETLAGVLKGIDALKKQDYTVKLGSLLEASQREYYVAENFKLLKLALQERIGKVG